MSNEGKKTTNRKGLPKGTGLVNGMNERQLRAESAHERLLARIDRSSTQQARELDRRLGDGTGAKRERKRLAA